MARVLLALMVLGSLGWAVSWQPLRPQPSARSDHRELERFAEEVARRTPPHASIFFILPDGRAPEVVSTIYPSLRNDLHSIFTATSSLEALNGTQALGFGQTYVVISTRTAIWAQQDPSNIYTGPIPGASFDPLLRIFVPPHFAVQFSTPTTYVFNVTP